VPLLLARIDDRLIHGQVVHGWGRPLKPTWIAIVSDALRADPARADCYLFAAPEGSNAVALSVEETLSEATRRTIDAERAMLLFPGVDEPLRLKQGGFALEEVNVGGMHHAPGKDEVLPYVYLDAHDREALRALLKLGVRVVARDLPTNPAHPLEPLLGAA
jgi:mannose/fructose/N-acetylgalactosamine-specific phosphotransferase system component IIB